MFRLTVLVLAAGLSGFIQDPGADTWIELGGSATGGGVSASSGISLVPSCAVDSLGRPVVAWFDNSSGIHQIYLRRWDSASGAWQELGGSATGGGLSATASLSLMPSLAIDGTDAPVVAWSVNLSGNREIYVRRWDEAAAAWLEIGGSATAGGISSTPLASGNPALALDAWGQPIVAWQEGSSGSEEIYLKRWNAASGAWEEIGGSATGGGLSASADASTKPALAVDASGSPVVAWAEVRTGIYRIYARRWNPATSSWEEIGESATGGGISGDSAGGFGLALKVDSSGAPVVAWDDQSTVYLKRWDPLGNAWAELAGSGSGNGVSGAGGTAIFPSVAVDGDGNPIVTWQEDVPGNGYEIHLRRWDSTTSAWEELAGSATGGGISATPITTAESGAPKIALDPSGNPVVAWHDAAPGNFEIYVKAFQPGPPSDDGGSGGDPGVDPGPGPVTPAPSGSKSEPKSGCGSSAGADAPSLLVLLMSGLLMAGLRRASR